MKKYMILLILLLIPFLVNAKDFSNAEIKNGDTFSSGDVLYKNKYKGTLIPSSYFGYSSKNLVKQNVNINFYKLVDNSTKENPIYELYSSLIYGTCEEANVLVNGPVCNKESYKKVLVPKVDDKDVYWYLKGISYTKDNYAATNTTFISSVIINVYELWYEEPSVSLSCDVKELVIGDSTICHLSMVSNYDLANAKFDIESDYLKMSKFTLADGWSYEENNGSVSFKYVSDKTIKADEDSSFEILSFEVETKEDVDSEVSSNLVVNNFVYEDTLGESSIDAMETNLKVKNVKVNNPNTSTFSFVWMLISIVIFSASIFYILVNRDILKEIKS